MKNKKVGWRRLLSLFLVIVLLVQIVPIQVLAAEVKTDSVPKNEELVKVTADQESGPIIIGEVKALREEDTKHFMNTDGSYTAVKYTVPVHFRDSDDAQWLDIDNTLSISKSDTKSYTPASSPIDVSFANEFSESKTVTLHNKGYELSWSYLQTDVETEKTDIAEAELGLDADNAVDIASSTEEPTREKVIQAKKLELDRATESANTNEIHTRLDKLMDGLVYSDVLPDVDIEYILNSVNLKENIILKSCSAQDEFFAQYNIGDLTAKQMDEQNIELLDSNGEAVFCISAPCMFDANNIASSNVAISIVSEKEKTLQVKITADKEWLHDSYRVYPVRIDPDVLKSTQSFDEDATAIFKNIPSSIRPYGSLVIGNDQGNNYGRAKAFVKFSLPTLGAGDMVIDGQLQIYQFPLGQNEYGYSGSVNSLQINLYRVTSSWRAAVIESSHDYIGLPSVDSTVIDYLIASRQTCNSIVSFDVSKVVKMWYEDTATNYGLCLCADDESANALAIFAASNNLSISPFLQITYRNNKGLEGYWSNHEQNLGESGVGYVNDYSGNLVFVAPLLSTAGNKMPLSLSLVYNGYMAGKASGFATKCGNGWMLSIQNKLTIINPNGSDLHQNLYSKGYRYIYSDSDGTDHYLFLNSAGKTVDEDGLGLTLTEIADNELYDDSEIYVLESDDGSKITFLSNGNVRCFYSSDYNAELKNRIKVFYNSLSGGVINYIEDGVGRQTHFTYYSDDKIERITDPSGRSIVFTYSNNNISNLLTKIEYPDGTYTGFAYTSSKLFKIRARNGMRIKYTYLNTGYDVVKSRVVGIEEYNRNDTGSYASENIGNSLTIDYSKMNRTRFTDNRGRKETYTFDNAGRTVNIFDASGGAGMYSYQSPKTKSRESNTMMASSQTEKFVDNLLRNHSFESGTTAWALTANTASISEDKYYLGKKSMHLNAGGRFSQKIGKTSGTYNISAYIAGTNTPSEATIHAVCYNSSDDVISTISSKEFSLGTGWSRVFFPFTLPSGTAYFRARIENSGSDDIWVDCMQVESGSVMNAYNLVGNGGFENTESTAWSSYNCTDRDGYVTGTNYGRSIRIYGDTSNDKIYYQRIYINKVAKNVHFSISGKAYAYSVPLRSSDDDVSDTGRRFALEIRTVFENNNTPPLIQTQSFNSDCDGMWQYTSGTMGYSDSSIRNETIEYIQIRCSYSKNANYAVFDHIQVNLDETGTAYTYDDKGNLISAKDNAGRNQSYSYSTANELTSATTADNKNYSYTYGTTNKHRLVSATSNSSNIKFGYIYDDFGNVTRTTARKPDGTGPYIRQYTTYTDDIVSGGARDYRGNYVKTSGDDRGRTTTYGYALMRGLLTSVIDPEGNETKYRYYTGSNNDIDSNKLKSVSSGGSEVYYEYNTYGELTKIAAGATSGAPSTEYSFTYDAFGNSLSTKVGNYTLVTNEYNANNGTLSKQTYGNRYSVSYIYDDLDRETARKYNGTTLYKWAYNALGQVGIYTDNVTGNKYYYTYDDIGRLVRTEVSDGSWFKTSYNTIDLATQLKYHYAGLTRTVSYAYSSRDNMPESTTFSTSYRVKNTYDDLGRIITKAYDDTETSNNQVKAQYTYKNVVDDRTSSRIAAIDYTTKGGLPIDDLFYIYDDNGNIVDIYKGANTAGTLLEHYAYDSKNQLIRNDSTVQDATFLYTYDATGNITAVKEYAYTTEETSTLTDAAARSVKTYTYGDSSWGDLLTSYNGQSIVYANQDNNNIGNPLSYRGWTMGWQGRRLVSANNYSNNTPEGQTDNGDESRQSIDYTYNADGIRTSKTVNGVTTEYLLNGTQILAQKTGSSVLWFIYDSEGNRIALIRNGYVFYYICNQQGDVIALAQGSNGQIVATYNYDAWGNIVRINGQSPDAVEETSLAKINPFRYRGYYYDTDTGLYYLNSRYYDPGTGRFINADGQLNGGVLGNNLFSYCENNPINCSDNNGANWRTAFGMGLAVAAIGLVVLATLPFSGPLLAGAGIAASTVATAANVTVATGLSVAGGALFASNNEHGNSQNSTRNSNERTSPNQMQEQVNRGQAPREVDRVDKGKPSIPDNKDHIHFKDGTALNYDGSPSHEGNGLPKITRAISDWIQKNNWGLPK